MLHLAIAENDGGECWARFNWPFLSDVCFDLLIPFEIIHLLFCSFQVAAVLGGDVTAGRTADSA